MDDDAVNEKEERPISHVQDQHDDAVAGVRCLLPVDAGSLGERRNSTDPILFDVLQSLAASVSSDDPPPA